MNPSIRYSVFCPKMLYGASRTSTLRKLLLFAIVVTILAVSPLCQAQTPVPSLTSGSIERLRADTQADRVTIITTAMEFSDKDAAAFWPIYRKYEFERSTLDDRRVAVIKEYAAKYPNLTDSEAKDMSEKMFDCDARLAELKKRYFKKFNEVLPSLTVTKFFQLDHRIDLLIEMQVESALPPLARAPQVDGPEQ